MKLLQIVPALSPPANGVGDYATAVAQALRGHGIESSFFVSSTLTDRSAAAVAGALERTAGDGPVLLQFSPYGYEPNGCPFWLAAGLKRWKAGGPRRLITVFHELYAGGAPWTRAFWVAGLQKRAIRRVLDCTDAAITNMQRYASELRSWSNREVHCLPVPSNVGEPRMPPPLARRARRVCMFGIRPGQREVSALAARTLRDALQAWSIEEIVLVGESPVPATFSGMGCPVIERRALPAADVGDVLQGCIAGLLSYPEAALGKSGVYAAYSAHGLASVLLPVPGSGTPSLDGPTLGQHFLDVDGFAVTSELSRLQDIADNARAWYGTHSTSAHAEVVARECAS